MSPLVTTLLFCMSILMLNIGGRYIFMDFQNPKLQKILEHPNMRLVYVFCIGFIGSRNIPFSALVATLYFIVVQVILKRVYIH